MSKTINEMLEGSSGLLREFLSEATTASKSSTKELTDDAVLNLEEDADWDLVKEYLLQKKDFFPDRLYYDDLTICTGITEPSWWDPGDCIYSEVDWVYPYYKEADDQQREWDIEDFIFQSKYCASFFQAHDFNAISWHELKAFLDSNECKEEFHKMLFDSYLERAVEHAEANWEPEDPPADDYTPIFAD